MIIQKTAVVFRRMVKMYLGLG